MSHTPANDKPANPFLQANGFYLGNLQTFQIYLSIQSIVLAAAYSWWQVQFQNFSEISNALHAGSDWKFGFAREQNGLDLRTWAQIPTMVAMKL